MRAHLWNRIALCLLVMAAAGSVNAQLSTSGSGPYYATPSWDQKLTTGRFVILTNWNNEAVLDRETGIVWQRAPSPSHFNWYSAAEYCFNLTLGGRDGWRLPALPELKSLVDRSQSSPSLPAGHPFNLGLTSIGELFYWASTTNASDTTVAWRVLFSAGDWGLGDKRGDLDRAWCVRGGPGPDTQ